jgi:prepilin-type N-terminal cleavage/methylation domain-containing protein
LKNRVVRFFYSSECYRRVKEKPTEVEMFARFSISDQKGFTLIELISVMIIMAVMASVAVKRLDLVTGTATDRVFQEAVHELNEREHLTWIDIKLSSTNWRNDADVFSVMDTNLGGDFVWSAGPNASGGTLSFRSVSSVLSRTASTTSSSGRWN